MRGKSSMLVAKGGKIYNFGSPDKQSNKKLIRSLEPLVADDPQYLEYLRTLSGRRDKVLRSLSLYNPEGNQ